MLRPSPRIAVVIRRIGPYHRARLQALAAQTPVLALETCAADATYAWEAQESGAFARATLFATEAEASDIPALQAAVTRALDAFAPDVVAVPGWADPAGLLALAWARRHGRRVVLMSDSQAHDAPRRAHAEAIKRWVVARAGAGLVAGPPHADYLVQLGLPRARIALGYDVVDNAHFAQGAAAARADPQARTRLGLPPRYLLALARFVEKKNLATLIAAHARWHATAADPVPLLLVGDGQLADDLRRAAGPAVLFHPFADYATLPALYALAEGFVLSSTVEQWGLTVNEAMASGCPVIATDRAGATATLLTDGVSGIVTAPDESALTTALSRLMAADRTAMAEAACAVIAAWGSERFAAGMLQAALGAVAPGARNRPLEAALLRRLAGRSTQT